MTIRKLESNQKIKQILKRSNGYCPCSLTKTEDDKCQCKDFRDKCAVPNWYGPCGCGLFEKVKE